MALPINKMIYDPISLRNKCEENKYMRNRFYHHINSFNTIKSKSNGMQDIDILSVARYKNHIFQYRKMVRDRILYKVINGVYVITSYFGRC